MGREKSLQGSQTKIKIWLKNQIRVLSLSLFKQLLCKKCTKCSQERNLIELNYMASKALLSSDNPKKKQPDETMSWAYSENLFTHLLEERDIHMSFITCFTWKKELFLVLMMIIFIVIITKHHLVSLLLHFLGYVFKAKKVLKCTHRLVSKCTFTTLSWW